MIALRKKVMAEFRKELMLKMKAFKKQKKDESEGLNEKTGFIDHRRLLNSSTQSINSVMSRDSNILEKLEIAMERKFKLNEKLRQSKKDK